MRSSVEWSNNNAVEGMGSRDEGDDDDDDD